MPTPPGYCPGLPRQHSLSAGGCWARPPVPIPMRAGVSGDRDSRRGPGWPRGDRRGHLPHRSRINLRRRRFHETVPQARDPPVDGTCRVALRQRRRRGANTRCYPGTGPPPRPGTRACDGPVLRLLQHTPSPHLRRAAAAGRAREHRCHPAGGSIEEPSAFSGQSHYFRIRIRCGANKWVLRSPTTASGAQHRGGGRSVEGNSQPQSAGRVYQEEQRLGLTGRLPRRCSPCRSRPTARSGNCQAYQPVWAATGSSSSIMTFMKSPRQNRLG